MKEFLITNTSAIFAIAGAILGSLTTGFLSYLSKIKETKLRLTEKLLDKKLDAHESLINIAGLIRSMVLLGGEDTQKDLKRCPLIMKSKENMIDFLDQFMSLQNKYDRWWSSEIKREISFFLDYFVNLNEYSRNATDDNLQAAGVIVRKDFIDFSLRFESLAHDFFNEDLLKLDYKTDKDWNKHSKEKTLEELGETEFFKHKQRVMEELNW